MPKTQQPERQTSPKASGIEAKTDETPVHDAPVHDAKTEANGSADLEKVREILLGAPLRDLERKLVRVDTHLLAQTHELEQECRRRTKMFETHLKKETEALAERVDRENGETGSNLRKMSSEHHEAIADLEQKLAKLEELSAQGQRELRRQLLDQSKSFLDELQSLRKELLATLQQEIRLAQGDFGEGRDAVEYHAKAEQH